MFHLAARDRACPLWAQLCAALTGLGSTALVVGVLTVLAPSGESGASEGHVDSGQPVVVTTAEAGPAEPAGGAEAPARPSAHGDSDDPQPAGTSGGPAVPEPATVEPPELPSPAVDAQYVDAGQGVGEQAAVVSRGDGSDGGDGHGGPDPGSDSDHDAERQRRATTLAERFPAHAQARQRDDPTSRRWALVVGVNTYQGGGVSDTFGSVPDARVLAGMLDDAGWRDDHVLVLTDADATGEMIRAGIEWLADRTDDTSEVVVSFSGHLQHRDGVTALWPADHDYLWADEVGDRFADVEADRMWMSFQGCHAQGLRSPQLHRDGRVITYSSKAAEKSHEDPETGHSVQGHYLFAEALSATGGGSAAEPPSVQEAFRQAAPRIHRRTADQQTPQIWDGLDEPFRLAPAE